MFELSDWAIAVIFFWLVCLLICLVTYVINRRYKYEPEEKSFTIINYFINVTHK